MDFIKNNYNTLLMEWIRLKTKQAVIENSQDGTLEKIEEALLNLDIIDIELINISKDYYTLKFKHRGLSKIKQFISQQIES
ncbi:hypothetical protein [Clostridium sp. UBA5712]|uniref:hypothetical protein n=1 Tax=Clostridium sp. UBA5712 TaxID=1946368 RepID=UPI0032164C72